MIFSSDHVNNVPVELKKYESIIPAGDLGWVLGKTAQEVFSI